MHHTDLLVGVDDADDAGVFQLDSSTALVQTVDFFTPVVDDPGDWGRIAASNALSDVYAMGGRPLTALQLLGWPRGELPFEIAGEVISGAAEVMAEAGCTVVGGHSVDDREPKFGFAVTGVVSPDAIVRNVGGRPGDALVLTKPIGTGIIATAQKADAADAAVVAGSVATMVSLNRDAAAAMAEVGVNSATDVTGFGLLGHLAEMLHGVGAVVEWEVVPLLPGVEELAIAGHVPGGTKRNLEAMASIVDFGVLGTARRAILCDAQTSGGLLMAVDAATAEELARRTGGSMIGHLTDDAGRIEIT